VPAICAGINAISSDFYRKFRFSGNFTIKPHFEWAGYFGVVTATVLAYGNLEVYGAPASFVFNRAGSKMIAIWLLLVGINLLLKKEIIDSVGQAKA
jgi:hypothetical protein